MSKTKANKVRDIPEDCDSEYCSEKRMDAYKASQEMTEEQLNSICYKSKLLNKYFDSYAELQEAEKKYHEENDAKLKLAEQKKARAEEIKVLKQKTVDARREAQKLISDADDAYYKARAEFIKDYGSYHESYYSDGKSEMITVNDVLDSFFPSLKSWFF